MIKLAEEFDVEYLAFATRGQKAKFNIQDRELLRRFEQLDTTTEKEKELAKEFLDLVICSISLKSWAVPALLHNQYTESDITS